MTTDNSANNYNIHFGLFLTFFFQSSFNAFALQTL